MSLVSFGIRKLRTVLIKGDTRWRFSLIQNLEDLERSFTDLENDDQVALACFNDDQPDDGPEGVSERFGEWMQERWGHVHAPWEKKIER